MRASNCVHDGRRAPRAPPHSPLRLVIAGCASAAAAAGALGALAHPRRTLRRFRKPHAALRAAFGSRQPALLRGARQAVLRACDGRWVSRTRRGVLVRPRLSRCEHVERRALRHVRNDGRAQDPAAALLRTSYKSAQRPQRRRAGQRSRAVQGRTHHRPLALRRVETRHAARRARHSSKSARWPRARRRLHAPAASARRPASLYVQAGAFAAEANACAPACTAALAGGRERVSSGRTELAGKPLYRVRIGPIPTVREFDRIVARLKSLGVADARLAAD